MINKKFENHLETIALEFLENRQKYKKILSIHHTDADGITSGAIIRKMLERLKLPLLQKSFDLDIPWDKYMKTLEPILELPSAIIFSDLGPSGKILCDFTTKYPEIDIYILDHHLFQKDPVRKLPENVYNANPTEFGLHGLKEIVGSTLNYLFVKIIDKKNTDLAWMAVLGMGGDTLDHINDYKSYDKLVVEEAIELEQVDLHRGICAFGGQFERIDKALSLSILPYIPDIGGDWKKAKEIIENLGIIPKTKVEDLTIEESKQIADAFDNQYLIGEYVTFPKKKGLLRHVFEHAHLLSIIGHSDSGEAFRLMGAIRNNKEQKEKYIKFISSIVRNLTKFVNTPKTETEFSLIIDLTNKIPKEFWSNTGSFATINKIYPQNKVLFMGGELKKKNEMKFSVRCSQKFVKNHSFGANVIIKSVVKRFGGNGGGHDLAGGIQFETSKFNNLKKEIDNIIQNLLPETK